MKKHIIITCIIAVAMLFIGYIWGDTAAVNRFNKAVDANVSKNTSTANKKVSTTQNTKKDDAKIYKLGEEGQSGSWKIKVLDVKETNTIQSGDGSENKTTQQKFIVLNLQMTNVSQAATQYEDNEFVLGNTKSKKQYQVDGDASLIATEVETNYKNNSNFFLAIDNLNPDTPKDTYLVFEVPKDFDVADGVLIHGDSNKAVGYYIK